MTPKATKFQNIRIDLLPATNGGKLVCWFPIWYFQNLSYVYICSLHIMKSEQIFKSGRIDLLQATKWGKTSMLIPNMIFSKPSNVYIYCLYVTQSKQISKIVGSNCIQRLSVVNMYSDYNIDIIKISHMNIFVVYISWKIKKFQIIRIDLLPATECGKHVYWFTIIYFQNSHMYINCCIRTMKSEQISKVIGSTCLKRLSGVNKYAESEYDIFKTLICIHLLFICHSK